MNLIGEVISRQRGWYCCEQLRNYITVDLLLTKTQFESKPNFLLNPPTSFTLATLLCFLLRLSFISDWLLANCKDFLPGQNRAAPEAAGFDSIPALVESSPPQVAHSSP